MGTGCRLIRTIRSRKRGRSGGWRRVGLVGTRKEVDLHPIADDSATLFKDLACLTHDVTACRVDDSVQGSTFL